MIVPTITFGEETLMLPGGVEGAKRMHANKLVDAQRGTRLGARKTQTPFNARDT